MNFVKPTQKNEKDRVEIIKLLNEYAKNIEDPIANFKLGKYYDTIGQSSTAVTYYMRCAGRSEDKMFQYSSLVGAATCYEREGYRDFTAVSLMRNALMVDLERPEAYFYFAKQYENKARATNNVDEASKHWHDCYMYACMGLKFAGKNIPALYVASIYPGYYGLVFMKALSSWYCGMPDQSKSLFMSMLTDYGSVMSKEFKAVVQNNLNYFANQQK
jgi:hypothetical protein